MLKIVRVIAPSYHTFVRLANSSYANVTRLHRFPFRSKSLSGFACFRRSVYNLCNGSNRFRKAEHERVLPDHFSYGQKHTENLLRALIVGSVLKRFLGSTAECAPMSKRHEFKAERKHKKRKKKSKTDDGVVKKSRGRGGSRKRRRHCSDSSVEILKEVKRSKLSSLAFQEKKKGTEVNERDVCSSAQTLIERKQNNQRSSSPEVLIEIRNKKKKKKKKKRRKACSPSLVSTDKTNSVRRMKRDERRYKTNISRDDFVVDYKSKRTKEEDDELVIKKDEVMMRRKFSLGSELTCFDTAPLCTSKTDRGGVTGPREEFPKKKSKGEPVRMECSSSATAQPGVANLKLESRLRLGNDGTVPSRVGCVQATSSSEGRGRGDRVDREDDAPSNRHIKKDRILFEKLKKLREDEFTVRGQGLLYEPWHPREKKYKFRVLSYNVLAQKLLEMNPQLYRNHNPAHLNWTYRGPLLMDELLRIDADILCLQEVEASYKEIFFDQLLKHGYEGVFKKRTGDKFDGCAIYFKTSMFGMVEYTGVEFSQPGVDVLNRDNVGLIAKIHPIGWPKQPIVVATTHLLYNPRRHDVKLAQMQLFLAEIERLAYITPTNKHTNFTYHPVILAGDFNVVPYTAVYHLLMASMLQYEFLDCRLLKMNGPSPPLGKFLLPPYLGINDNCQHTEILDIRDKGFGTMSKVQERMLGIRNSDKNLPPKICHICEQDRKNFSSGVLTHKFDFESVYYHQDDMQNQPEATTNHNEWITVDYMLYTPQMDKKFEHHQLQLINRTRLPTAMECEKVLRHIPNSVCPSDHLPLVATFFLRIRPFEPTPE